MVDLKKINFSDVTEYGLIGIIGLGSDVSCQLNEVDFLASNEILSYNSYRDIDRKSIKQLCDVSDVIFVVTDLDDIAVDKSIWGLISYLKDLDTNLIIIAKTSHASLNLATTIKQRVPFIDLSKQENNNMLWTLKNLHRIIHYHNDEYNFKDANYPPSMFWESFFKTNSEILLYKIDSVLNFLEKMEISDHINKQLNISKHCLLSRSNTVFNEVDTLVHRIEEEIGEDTDFYIKDEKFNDLLLLLSG